MITALILVCAIGTAPRDCHLSNAMDVIQGPTTSSMADCGLLTQSLLASNAATPGSSHYLKVRCTPAGLARREVEIRAAKATISGPIAR